MKLRRRSGAVLSLVAACVVLIVILGIGLYFLTKMFGGGREVAHATDSGILNVAKQELDSPNVSCAGTDFEWCCLPTNSKVISLYTYNRCVGQAMLVALNAYTSGSTTAGQHAQTVQQQLVNSIEKPLQQALVGSNSVFQNAFTGLANMNNTRMSGNNYVQSAGYGVAYMKGGTSNQSAVASSNLYFPAAMSIGTPAVSLIPVNSSGTYTPESGQTYNGGNAGATYYVQGYKSIQITVPGVGPLSYMAVPTFPWQPPHLVSIGDFNSNLTAPSGDSFVPPNSFKVASASLDSNAGGLGGSVACAMIGSVDGGYSASLPAGYIEIYNRPGTTLTNPDGSNMIGPVDNSQNIFNNEMFGNPGVSVALVPGGPGGTNLPVFSCAYPGAASANPPAKNLVDMWADYNSGVTSVQPPVSGQSGDNNGLDDNIYIGTSGTPGASAAAICASVTTLKKIMPGQNSQCLAQEQGQGYLSGECLKWMGDCATTYNKTMPTTNGAGQGVDLTAMGPVFSNVDYIKMAVITQFQNRYQSFQANAPNTPQFPDNHSMDGSTGMGVFTDVNSPGVVTGLSATYPSPQNTLPIMKQMSPWNYLQQIDAWGNSQNCGTNTSTTSTSVLNSIWHRCQQIQPSVTQLQVKNLLNSNLTFGMGSKYYIYLPYADQTQTGPYGGLAMDAGGASSQYGGPVGYNASNPAIPDGTPVPAGNLTSPSGGNIASHCAGTYELVGRMVNVSRNPPYWGVGAQTATNQNSDLYLHAQPYYGGTTAGITPSTPSAAVAGQPTLTGVDHALWQDSSGYGNLLGHLEFANTILGANNFNATN